MDTNAYDLQGSLFIFWLSLLFNSSVAADNVICLSFVIKNDNLLKYVAVKEKLLQWDGV